MAGCSFQIFEGTGRQFLKDRNQAGHDVPPFLYIIGKIPHVIINYKALVRMWLFFIHSQMKKRSQKMAAIIQPGISHGVWNSSTT